MSGLACFCTQLHQGLWHQHSAAAAAARAGELHCAARLAGCSSQASAQAVVMSPAARCCRAVAAASQLGAMHMLDTPLLPPLGEDFIGKDPRGADVRGSDVVGADPVGLDPLGGGRGRPTQPGKAPAAEARAATPATPANCTTAAQLVASNPNTTVLEQLAKARSSLHAHPARAACCRIRPITARLPPRTHPPTPGATSPQASGLAGYLGDPSRVFTLFAPDDIAWQSFFEGAPGLAVDPLAAAAVAVEQPPAELAGDVWMAAGGPAACLLQPPVVLYQPRLPAPPAGPSLPPWRRVQPDGRCAGGRPAAAGGGAAVPRGAGPGPEPDQGALGRRWRLPASLPLRKARACVQAAGGAADGWVALRSGCQPGWPLLLQAPHPCLFGTCGGGAQWSDSLTLPTLAAGQVLGVRLPTATSPNYFLEGAQVGRVGSRLARQPLHCLMPNGGFCFPATCRNGLGARPSPHSLHRRATCWAPSCSPTSPPAALWWTWWAAS